MKSKSTSGHGESLQLLAKAVRVLIAVGVDLSVEIRLGIIAACVPIIKPLFTHRHPVSYKDWKKIFTGRSTPSLSTEDIYPLRGDHSRRPRLPTHEHDLDDVTSNVWL